MRDRPLLAVAIALVLAHFVFGIAGEVTEPGLAKEMLDALALAVAGGAVLAVLAGVANVYHGSEG